MFNSYSKNILFIILTIVLSAGAIFGQTSSFTYQGRLNDGGTPANEDLMLKVERQPASSGNWLLAVVKTKHDKALGASGIGLERYTYKMNLPLGFKTNDTYVVDDYDSSKEARAMKEKPAYAAG